MDNKSNKGWKGNNKGWEKKDKGWKRSSKVRKASHANENNSVKKVMLATEVRKAGKVRRAPRAAV